MATTNEADAGQIIAAQLILDVWREIEGKYPDLPVEKRLQLAAACEADLIGVAAVLRSLATNVAILSSASSTRQRAAAAAMETERLAARGDGSLDRPLKASPHLDLMAERATERTKVVDVGEVAAALETAKRAEGKARAVLATEQNRFYPPLPAGDPKVEPLAVAVREAEVVTRAAQRRLDEVRSQRA